MNVATMDHARYYAMDIDAIVLVDSKALTVNSQIIVLERTVTIKETAQVTLIHILVIVMHGILAKILKLQIIGIGRIAQIMEHAV